MMRALLLIASGARGAAGAGAGVCAESAAAASKTSVALRRIFRWYSKGLSRGPEQLGGQRREHQQRPDGRLVFAVAEIEVARELPGSALLLRTPPRQQPRDARDVSVEVAGETLAQETFFEADGREINGQEHQRHARGEPPAPRRPCQAGRHDAGTKVERIARVRIRSGGGQLARFLHVAGSVRAQPQAERSDGESDGDRAPRRLRQPEINDGEGEAERDADAAR